ncbi:type I-E CRISPR-associated protein Cse2/CasB [Paratractidigestivibacter sp.]|uniref:type I-E CRISPR-associated protein Cse2/CasB n=1 Tax=Paratractidigestivibacter sp. TaxID=2847316 RepID=UPI002ACB0ED8|nr:type I-E CRISPR-associated protein Cse2/CasB [Paratractidigestivibacter sp.]
MSSVGYKKQEQIASLAATYAMSKIAPLQDAYLGMSNARAAWARATLAKLRRLGPSAESSWLQSGDQLFDGWPSERLAELNASLWDEERMQRSHEAVLSLYALHQQSSRVRCASVPGSNESEEERKKRCRRSSFARCCREIEEDLDRATGVRRRLIALESAKDFDGIVYGIRGLLKMIKASGAAADGVDYYALARDLYLLQTTDHARGEVFSRWSKDYFATLD